jgi:fermentation-respiration switch protein FrsA (DUF1100 family)
MSPGDDSPVQLDLQKKARPRWIISRLWPLLRSAVVVYLLVVLILMLFENRLIFPAPTSSRGDWEPHGLSYEDVDFQSEDGTQLHGWIIEHTEPSVHILFCHGNAEHVADLADLLYKYHHEYQATVFAFDYRGYGRSEGRPNERGVVADGHAAQKWLANHLEIPASEIVIIGRSLGGAVAVELAATNGARGLVLERTFSSLPEVASRHFPWLPVKLLMRNRFDSVKKIKAYRGPILQTHGTDDEVVPYELGKRLFDAADCEEKNFVVVKGGTHNEPHRREYWNALAAFIEGIASK